MSNNKNMRGTVYVLGDNIDTDQILSAEYLKINPASEEGREELASLAMCGLPEGSLPFINPKTQLAGYDFIVAGKNFGCGSSREHAVVALGASGIKAVIAHSFARIFFRNCVSTGQLIPVTLVNGSNTKPLKTGDEIDIDLDAHCITTSKGVLKTAPVGELANIVSAGGLFAYGKQTEKI
ncbi:MULTISPECIES: LeuD/DmdB family oxidoreductase small subunit [Tenebrionibacter/Tenebrionicola group]|jgi:3-isopropylmalate/(R)-2-methylmalate dehydratase small subunit|uniref:3-isopropylmalate dehydratase n=2 Tax=Tenebrionibacter/Tenebrionicola group TaxID=2969848 RepID=A0A8K0V9I0_9ENTR|nr:MULTISPECIES: 3-isopropylmalate dehydratase [Tenebrionibacter/Tenebrionicola group]MBK4716650.1 3-isopropylmalate dehydratase [Tenebrionibacter intestinalis]MBV5097324.1 3-isopropylmalate dehydratase [Tenebrionicola larvae]